MSDLRLDNGTIERICRLWRLISDARIAKAITILARERLNYHCADLVEIWTNVNRMQWYTRLPHGCTIHQFGIDLLRRLLAADVERFYDQAIIDARNEIHPPYTIHSNPNNNIAINHWSQMTQIVPDMQHALELANRTEINAIALADLADRIKEIAESSRRTSEWTEQLYTEGANAQRRSHDD